MKTTANIQCMTASLEFGLQCSVIFLFILHLLHLYCSPNFARFYFLLAFRTDKRNPVLCFIEPTATFARWIFGKKRFFIIGIQQLLATYIAVQINLVANFTIVPFKLVRAIWTGYFVGVHWHYCNFTYLIICFAQSIISGVVSKTNS